MTIWPLKRSHLVWGAMALAGLWRLLLAGRYSGWEESDYGNLAMVRGVLDGGFLHYDMNHLPLYYGASALVMGVLGDAVLAARSVSLVAGVATVGLGVFLADRLGGRALAVVAGLVLVFQPELALYSASSLREPLYAALVLASLCMLFEERLVWGGVFAGLAFLTRMDALLTLAPVLVLHGVGRAPRWNRVFKAVLPLVVCVLIWSLYCRWEHGTFAFWGHSVAVNVETGAAPDSGWWGNGCSVVASLASGVLASRVGWGLWVGFWLGLFWTPWRRHGPQRTLGLAALTMVGFWLGIGLVAQHEPGHNLYWKWLHAVIPLVALIGLGALWQAGVRVRNLAGLSAVWVVGLVLSGQAVMAFSGETQRQLALSDRLYGSQLELARWIENEIPENEVLLVDNIPGAWIDRRHHERRLWTWFDVLEGKEAWDRTDFGAWLADQEIRYVLWFKEEWTQAPRVAPWLGGEEAVTVGCTVLEPLDREDEYGWVFYRVSPTGC